MDITSPHMPYVLGAFIFAVMVLFFLIFWSVREDRRIVLELKKWKSNEAEA